MKAWSDGPSNIFVLPLKAFGWACLRRRAPRSKRCTIGGAACTENSIRHILANVIDFGRNNGKLD